MNNSICRVCVLVVILSFWCLRVQGDVHYVSPDGGDVPPYDALQSAARSIQPAVDAAEAGDLVLVDDGSYVVSNSIEILKGITVRSVNGYAFTAVDGNHTARCFHVDHPMAVVDGFTITNGWVCVVGERGTNVVEMGEPAYAYGGGVYIGSGGSLLNCAIVGNSVTATGGSSTISAGGAPGHGYGGGVYMATNGVVSNCVFIGNTAKGVGGTGGVGPFSSGTRGGDGVGYGGGVGVALAGAVLNCVFSNNTAFGVGGNGDGVSYHGSLHAHGGDGHGMGGAIYLLSTGLVEDCSVSANEATGAGGGTLQGGYNGAGFGYGGAVYSVGGTIRNCSVSSNAAATAGSGAWLENGLLDNSSLCGNLSCGAGGGVYVSANAMILNCLISGNAIYGQGGGAYILAGGTLQDSVIANNSSTGDYLLAVSGGGVYIGAQGALQNCLIVSNTVANSWKDGLGGGVFVSGTALIENCEIRCNALSASGSEYFDGRPGYAYGGGIYIATNATLRNCLVVSNTVKGVGGNCYLGYPGGQGGDGYAYGGGLYVAVTADVLNCTISRNASVGEGGQGYNRLPDTMGDGYGYAGGAFGGGIRSSILFANTALSGNAEHLGGGFICSRSTPLPPGEGNVANDPLFIAADRGDFRLATNSPCLNQGTNQAWMAGAKDLEGKPRIMGEVVDMGAYESFPLDLDTDLNGLPDYWEWRYGQGITNMDVAADQDGDGADNRHEYIAGTDPNSVHSCFKLREQAPQPGVGFLVEWDGCLGRSYNVMRATNLVGLTPFVAIELNIAGQDGPMSYIDATAANAAYYYRVEVRSP